MVATICSSEYMVNNKKKELSIHPNRGKKKTMFLEQVVSLKYVLGWGGAVLITVLPVSYGLGRWMQKTEDKFELHQKQVELNDTRTQLTLEFNEKVTNLERENAKLETLLEVCQGKEVNNGK